MLIRHDIFLAVAEEVTPGFMRKIFAQRDGFTAFGPVGHHHHATRLLGSATAAEGDAVRIVKIVVLFAVSKALTRLDQLLQFGNHRHVNLVLLAVIALIAITGTVQIRVKQARNALFAQQDQGVGQRFEPGFDRRFERLQRLSVMVCHQSYRMGRVDGDQRIGKQLRHIVTIALF
ncbi:hypothetical protein D3C75_882360 [compost metagenome]